MHVELATVSNEDRGIINNLFLYYVYELSSVMELSISSNGLYKTDISLLDVYWENNDHHPFLIMCDGEIAGFSLLRCYPLDKSLYDIGQFFVLRKFKNKGVGRKAFELSVSKFPGKWITRVLKENEHALKFWVTIIGEFTNDRYVKKIEIDGDLPMHFIRFEVNDS